MELHSAAVLTDVQRSSLAVERCAAYLDRLPLTAQARTELLNHIARKGDLSVATAMASLHSHLACNLQQSGDSVVSRSIRARLQICFDSPIARGKAVFTKDVHGRTRVVTTPALARASMVPQPWENNPLKRVWRWIGEHIYGRRGHLRSIGDKGSEPPSAPQPKRNWKATGHWRRSILLLLVVAQTYIASFYMTAVLPYHGQTWLEVAELVLYALLFGWISAGFWTAIMGFLILLRAHDKFSINASAIGDRPISPEVRTAILMPIYNEDVAQVFAGLRATYESVRRSGTLEHFDFFVLSDSSKANTRVAELDAWRRLCTAVGGYGRIFYRHRLHRIKRKSGNIADWCRRWGATYRYMVVLDADSIMSGDCLNRLITLMEDNPNAGIIQTAPIASGRDTLYARIQQFATRVYGPLFTAGLHFWQLGESHYWGHNAIIRVAPFIRHCALGRLPGRGSLSGEILSHDFVEAALMRRAGWAVWIAYDLPGSYEEMPPSLLDELKRDRRWCQGNLMNFRLFFSKGLHPAHRAVFMTGVMAYLSAPLWFAFLACSTALLALQTLTPPKYFIEPYQLFPVWPEWHPSWAIALFSATATLLFLPKILSVLLIWAKGARRFGGPLHLFAGMLLEFIFSALLAPIRMLFHTQFVIAALVGWPISWQSPPRDDAQTSWGEAVGRHGVGTLLGAAWGGAVCWLNPNFLWWLAPIVGSLVIAIPISVLSSRVDLGRRLRKVGLFLIPEENRPPRELRARRVHLESTVSEPDLVDAVTDPGLNALVCATGTVRKQRPLATQEHRRDLIRQALTAGPDHLPQADQNILLVDTATLSRLHFLAWVSADMPVPDKQSLMHAPEWSAPSG